MNDKQIQVLLDCTRGSLSGTMAFPEIVGQLATHGIERYHVDYSRQEITYYLADGDSHVVPTPHPPHPTGLEFRPAEIEAAVRQSQRGEHTYVDFVRKTMASGCVGYFVQITGQRAIYFGRNGDSHTEYFPQTKNDR